MSACLFFNEIEHIKKTSIFGGVKLHDFESIFFEMDSR